MTCHLPPGTSKWNKIEHRMFSHIFLASAACGDSTVAGAEVSAWIFGHTPWRPRRAHPAGKDCRGVFGWI